MKARFFPLVKLAGYLTIASVCFVMIGCQEATKKEDQTTGFNKVVVIVADDHSFTTAGFYGNQNIATPNMDRLADQAVVFNNAFCNAPICSASRQSMLTGKYPHATGVNLLFTPFPDEGNITIAEHLRDEGYKTALIGKAHFNNWAWSSLYEGGLPDHGFQKMVGGREYNQYYESVGSPTISEDIEVYDRSKAKGSIGEWMNSRVLPHPVKDEHSKGTFLANSAIHFIKENKSNPFFLWLAFHEPHHPYYFPIEFAGKYDPENIQLPEGSPEDDRWIPEKFKGLSEKEKKGIIAAYYTSASYMDKNIGLVLDAIDEMELDDETVVLYLSDNGYLLYDHKRFEKHTMWEESVRQPTIVKIPGVAAKKSDDLVEYVDVVPTILDVLGVDPISDVQGKSFRGVLAGEKADHKEFVFSTYLEDNMAMVRNKKWKYVFATGSRDLGIGYKTGLGPAGITHRLYDLENDINESSSVASRYPDQMLQLQNIMLDHFMKTHPDADKCPSELTLEGKLVWFCEPRDIGTDQSLIDSPVRVF